MSNQNHWIWMAGSGVWLFLMSVLALWSNYNQWEAPKDLATATQIVTAYFVAAVGERVFRKKP